MKQRYNSDDRRAQILAEALKIAETGRLYTLTMEEVATACGCTRPNVSYYFRDRDHMRAEIIVHARKVGSCKVLAQAIIRKDKTVENLTAGERAAVMETALRGEL